MQIIKTRRSCRHYRDEQVDDQLLHTVMEAGTYAPTGHGTQDPPIDVPYIHLTLPTNSSE